MLINGGLVLEYELLLGAVGDGHDVDVGELRSALAPVCVGENVVATNFASGFDLTPLGNPPVEERIVSRHALARCRWFHVLEESREPADHAALAQGSRYAKKLVERHASLCRATRPERRTNLVDLQLSLQRGENLPLLARQLNDIGIHHATRL